MSSLTTHRDGLSPRPAAAVHFGDHAVPNYWEHLQIVFNLEASRVESLPLKLLISLKRKDVLTAV
jgi:hypothetical protein